MFIKIQSPKPITSFRYIMTSHIHASVMLLRHLYGFWCRDIISYMNLGLNYYVKYVRHSCHVASSYSYIFVVVLDHKRM